MPSNASGVSSSTVCFSPCELDRAAGRAGRGEERDLLEREFPLFEHGANEPSHGAGGAHDGNRIKHGLFLLNVICEYEARKNATSRVRRRLPYGRTAILPALAVAPTLEMQVQSKYSVRIFACGRLRLASIRSALPCSPCRRRPARFAARSGRTSCARSSAKRTPGCRSASPGRRWACPETATMPPWTNTAIRAPTAASAAAKPARSTTAPRRQSRAS